MARSRPPKPPSALDGYRRLERTRLGAAPSVEPTELPTALDVDAAPRRARRVRVAGALRLVGFLAVLATIVGTSVGLAQADQEPKAATAARTATSDAVDGVVLGPDVPVARDTADVGPPKAETAPVADVTETSDSTPRASSDDTADESTGSGASPAPSASAAETSAVPTPAGALPRTGEGDVTRIVLAGSLFVLLGMLVQIAGQPLPARARARS